MKQAIYYWVILFVLSFLHIHLLLMNLQFNIPIYVSSIISLLFIYLMWKKVLLRISSLGNLSNGILVGLQLGILTFYVVELPVWGFVIPLLLSVGVELVRNHLGNKLFQLGQESEQFEQQRADFNETFRVVRSERHDFLKHVSSLHFMLENDQFEDAKSYLDELVEGYEETNLSIKGERGAVAGILHQLYGKATSLGIDVVYDFDNPISSLPLSDKDTVTLIGNLLTNSIDACHEWQQKYKRQALITMQFYKRSGLYLLICKNNSLPIPSDVLDNLFVHYGITTKEADHEGLGTKKIQDIVSKHEGFLDFTYKQGEFTIKIKIPAISS